MQLFLSQERCGLHVTNYIHTWPIYCRLRCDIFLGNEEIMRRRLLTLPTEVWRLEFVNWLIPGANIPWENLAQCFPHRSQIILSTLSFELKKYVKRYLAPTYPEKILRNAFLIVVKLYYQLWVLSLKNMLKDTWRQHTLRKSCAMLVSSPSHRCHHQIIF